MKDFRTDVLERINKTNKKLQSVNIDLIIVVELQILQITVQSVLFP